VNDESIYSAFVELDANFNQTSQTSANGNILGVLLLQFRKSFTCFTSTRSSLVTTYQSFGHRDKTLKKPIYSTELF